MNDNKQIANFLFEIGTMRKLLRAHRQPLLTDDLSDNISSHSYRVAIIGWFLAKQENADLYKVLMMCLLHDVGEIRSNDHNYIHKRYVKVFEEEIDKEQLGSLPFDDFYKLIKEYAERKTKESLIAKDADLLDQILLLREYEWQGNKEASIWLRGKGKNKVNEQIKMLKLKVSKNLGKAIYSEDPSNWWSNLWTTKNRV